MSLTHKQIIALQQLRLFHGDIYNMGEYACKRNIKIFGSKDLMDLINTFHHHSLHLIPEIRDVKEIDMALEIAQNFIEESEKLDIHITSLYDRDFPFMLRTTVDEAGNPAVPILLYYKGKLNAAKSNTIAIIGAKEPTKEGILAGKYFGKLFADEGFTIISGLSKGNNASALEGALESVKGKTCAFLSHGLDTIYPTENEPIANRILTSGGILFSEYSIGTKENPKKLIARDRLQAGLSLATLVLQMGLRGETMHSVKTAIKANKPLYYVQYKDSVVLGRRYKGGKEYLIEQGAQFINSKNFISVKDKLINTNLKYSHY